MKFLCENELVELLPATPEASAEPLRAFEQVTPTDFRDPGFLKRAIDEGWTNPAFVCVADVPVYFLTYRLTDDGGLWIDILQSMNRGGTLAQVNAAVEHLAREKNRRYIRMTTKRRGLLVESARFGFKPEAVLLVKGVPC